MCRTVGIVIGPKVSTGRGRTEKYEERLLERYGILHHEKQIKLRLHVVFLDRQQMSMLLIIMHVGQHAGVTS